MLFILAGWSINDTGRTQELKSRSFIAEITVVQGLVSFNITSVQFGVLQLQRKRYKIEVLFKSKSAL